MPTPHDTLFQATFADPAHTGPLLRALLPPALVAAIDWDTLQPDDGNLIDEQHKKHSCDRLFQVRFAGADDGAPGRRGTAFLGLLLEHKSRADKWTVLQVLAYIVGVWRRLHGRRPRPRALPPVIPVLVHFGRGRWRTSTDLHALIDWATVPPALQPIVAAALPQFALPVHEFATRSRAEIRAMALSLHGLGAVSLLQFLGPFGADEARVRQALADAKDVLNRIAEDPTGQAAWESLTSYMLMVTRLGRRRLRTVIDQELGAPAMKKFVSTYDQILQEGEAKGEARGRAEGKAEGKAEGRAEVLLRLLQKRFGKVPAATEKRIRRAAIPDLDRWALAVLDAKSLRAVFAE